MFFVLIESNMDSFFRSLNRVWLIVVCLHYCSYWGRKRIHNKYYTNFEGCANWWRFSLDFYWKRDFVGMKEEILTSIMSPSIHGGYALIEVSKRAYSVVYYHFWLAYWPWSNGLRIVTTLTTKRTCY